MLGFLRQRFGPFNRNWDVLDEEFYGRQCLFTADSWIFETVNTNWISSSLNKKSFILKRKYVTLALMDNIMPLMWNSIKFFDLLYSTTKVQYQILYFFLVRLILKIWGNVMFVIMYINMIKIFLIKYNLYCLYRTSQGTRMT